MSFPCSSCGECCRRIPDGVLPKKADGSCVHLTQQGKCAIYADRPLVCRVDDTFVAGGFAEVLSLEEYYKATAYLCNQWIREAKLPNRFLVVLP